jgi:hypothetical protein
MRRDAADGPTFDVQRGRIMEAATPLIETLDPPRRRASSRRALRRAAWLAIDLLAIAGWAVYAVGALT